MRSATLSPATAGRMRPACDSRTLAISPRQPALQVRYAFLISGARVGRRQAFQLRKKTLSVGSPHRLRLHSQRESQPLALAQQAAAEGVLDPGGMLLQMGQEGAVAEMLSRGDSRQVGDAEDRQHLVNHG